MKLSSLRVLVIAILAAVFMSTLSSSPAHAATFAKPSSVKTVSKASNAVALSWKAVANAPAYQIQYSTSSKWTAPKYVHTETNGIELAGLKANTTYYLRVRVVSADHEESLSSYSATLKVKTAKTNGFSHLSPSGLRVTQTIGDEASLVWDSRGSGIRYRVQYSTSSKMSKPKYKTVTGSTARITGLTVNKTYYFKVRVIKSTSSKNLSSYSAAIKTKTAYTSAAPSGLKVSDYTQSATVLKWTAIPGVERYRVQFSKSSSMSKPSYYLADEAQATITGLKAGQAYWYKVRAITPTGGALSPYTGSVKLTMPKTADRKYFSPAPLVGSSAKPTALTLKWESRGSGLRYQLRYSTKSDFSSAKIITTTATSAELKPLIANTTYFSQVRVVNASGAALSPYTPATKITTQQGSPYSLTIGSYNVREQVMAYELEEKWTVRRPLIVETIKGQDPDILGIQEARQKKISGLSVTQYQDLVAGLGKPYLPTTTTQTSKSGVGVIYNSDRLTLIQEGSFTLEASRFLVWGVFAQNASGDKFVFGSTHLTQGHEIADDALRNRQARQAIAKLQDISAEKLPIILTGDMNTYFTSKGGNTPYETFTATFRDPLGSPQVAAEAAALKKIGTKYATYNAFERKARTSGTYMDYILVTPETRVTEWETVVKLDSKGNFIGTIPSDHNMIRATLWLR